MHHYPTARHLTLYQCIVPAQVLQDDGRQCDGQDHQCLPSELSSRIVVTAHPPIGMLRSHSFSVIDAKPHPYPPTHPPPLAQSRHWPAHKPVCTASSKARRETGAGAAVGSGNEGRTGLPAAMKTAPIFARPVPSTKSTEEMKTSRVWSISDSFDGQPLDEDDECGSDGPATPPNNRTTVHPSNHSPTNTMHPAICMGDSLSRSGEGVMALK